MAVSTTATESSSSPLVAPATPATAKMTAKTIKSEHKTFDELFSAIAAEVPAATVTMPMDAQTMLDEWLANDLQQTGLLADVADIPSLFSSPSVNGSPDPAFLGDSPLSGDLEMAVQPLFGSPLLGDLSDLSPMFSPVSSSSTSPITTPANAFESSPVLDVGLNFFPDLDSRPTPPSQSQKAKLETPTAALVAQLAAAGAFNIPWGTEPATRQLPLHPTDPLQQAAALAAAQAAAEYRLNGTQPGMEAAMVNTPSKRKTVDLDEIDMNDEAAVKRAKNTDAARRSRLKKVIKMEGLERRVTELEGENSKLVLKVAVLESEKAGGEARELEYERRIKRLEEQLREAHKALVESRTTSKE